MIPTQKGVKLTKHQQYNELIQEVLELKQALFYNGDKENLGEELMDVMQWCINIAYSQNIDINDVARKHEEKLIERGHKFVL